MADYDAETNTVDVEDAEKDVKDIDLHTASVEE